VERRLPSSGTFNSGCVVAAAGNSAVKNVELLRLRELYQNLEVAARVYVELKEAGSAQHTRTCCGRDGEDSDARASQTRSQKR